MNKVLAQYADRHPDVKRKDVIDYRGTIEGAMKRFVLIVMRPYVYYRMIPRRSKREGDWTGEIFEFLTTSRVPEDMDTAVVFGRALKIQRWITIFAGTFPISRRSFNSKVESVLHSSDTDYWCLV